MPKITIEVTEAEFYALELIAYDVQDWCDNVITDRARVAKEEFKTKPEYIKALTAVVKEGGDAEDDWAVLMKAKELGLTKTAVVQHEEFIAQHAMAAPEAPKEE